MESRSFRVRDIPSEERPRERMRRFGAQALSHAELLAVLLRTGTSRESAIHLAHRILSDHGGLRRLSELGFEELERLGGIGPAKAAQLQASVELGRRIARSRLPEMPKIDSPPDAADLLMEELRHYQEEHFVCLFLNSKNQVIGRQTMSIGTLNLSLVHPREVFKAAIRRSSASLICAHNHPSGDPTPSPDDILLTRRLAEGGRLLGIDLLDHLVIGDDRYISLKEFGCL